MERFKHLLNFGANLLTLAFEGGCFAWIWYEKYSQAIFFPFFRRGNWAVIGVYLLIIFFFTQIFGGYQIGYKRIMDIILSHILAIILSGIVCYLELCMIGRDYMDVQPVLMMCGIEILFIFPWVFMVRKLYSKLYPPRQMLLIYGNYAPDELIAKINTRVDKYNVCATVSCSIGEEALYHKIIDYKSVVLYDLPSETRNRVMKYCYRMSVRVYVTPKISDILLRGADDIHLFDTPLLLSRNQGIPIVSLGAKRIMDILLSAIGIIVAAPWMILIALCIKLYDKGPVFYTQERMTKDGRTFDIIKFRSMAMDSEKEGARLAAREDKRVTPIGRIIRNIHFDELPQLFNIFAGDMSLVGPRPERAAIAQQYQMNIPEFDLRLKVKAGLTGYAQVFGKYNTNPYDKLKLDLTYIENYSLGLDIKILLLTFKILFQKENTEGIEESQKTALGKSAKKP